VGLASLNRNPEGRSLRGWFNWLGDCVDNPLGQNRMLFFKPTVSVEVVDLRLRPGSWRSGQLDKPEQIVDCPGAARARRRSAPRPVWVSANSE
jgi:hypothetical protein